MSITVPIKDGAVTLSSGTGKCMGPDCKKQGGGMVDVRYEFASDAEVDHITLRFCGDHLLNLPLRSEGVLKALEQVAS